MEIISKEKVVKSSYNVYVANDGTEFNDRDECQKYEDSAEGVILAKIKSLVINDIAEEEILGWGSSDNTVWVVRPKSQDDVNTILQALLLFNPYYKKEDRKEQLEKERQTAQRALDENDVLFIGRGWEMDCFWFYGTRNSLKEKLNKFVEPNKESDNA